MQYVGVGPCIPVADVHELDLLDFDKGERQFRCKLASLYRLVDLFGWSHGIQSYITVSITFTLLHYREYYIYLVKLPWVLHLPCYITVSITFT